MDPHIHIITLGVTDLDRSVRFYRDELGFPVETTAENYVRFATGETQLALYPQELLAEDANVSPDGRGFSGVTLAHIVDSRDEIDRILLEAEHAGGTIVKPAQEATEFSGVSGYFSDPDGYLWEVASFD